MAWTILRRSCEESEDIESRVCPAASSIATGVDARRPSRCSAPRGYGSRAPSTDREPGAASSAAPGPIRMRDKQRLAIIRNGIEGLAVTRDPNFVRLKTRRQLGERLEIGSTTSASLGVTSPLAARHRIHVGGFTASATCMVPCRLVLLDRHSHEFPGASS